MKTIYGDDVDAALILTELELLKTLTKEKSPQNAADIFAVLRKLKEEILLIPNVSKIAKLLLVNGATSATPE